VVREAAARAGRDPRVVEITARLMVNLDPPGPAADVGVRRHITAYLNVPVYRAYQEWLGRGQLLAPMWDAWASGDRKGAVEAVPDEVARELIIRGSMDDIRAGVQRYLAAGIDTAFLQFSSSEITPERKREVILAATRALAPRVSERSP
jgi:alkanesulfonate monooxygenase SsuD/methylene tetrahydromethanopterin reductase-like flavin-dependent oxidoreductase (luciferase family)